MLRVAIITSMHELVSLCITKRYPTAIHIRNSIVHASPPHPARMHFDPSTLSKFPSSKKDYARRLYVKAEHREDAGYASEYAHCMQEENCKQKITVF
jgi:hypothetical protein